ncbi:MAG: PAS domain-containing protein [Bacteroidetes bacterium]|jgi:signal transduction histidine kinase/DNA-binding response OmpR family regulator|nr:PAS domain-containing protein [Bacteroidota bacterium]MBT6686788.1 PAS domain-containing protein [Bacteroidota bacterium]MBT7142375.1 PAS domain-containing protein [Bacteroidota bacterium]MBT7490314.1 PAS domain-containing protein [Bacteroidota bacterium]
MTSILREPITKRILILVLVSFAALVLVIYVENIFYNDSQKLTVELNNQYASRNILKSVNRNLLEIEREYNGYNILDSISDIRNSGNKIKQSVAKISEILNIYRKGGIYKDTLYLNLYEIDEIVEEFHFSASEDSTTLSILDEMEQNLEEILFSSNQLISTLIRKSNITDELRSNMLEKAIASIKIQTEPIITNFRNDVNFLRFETNEEIILIEDSKKKSIHAFFFFRYIFVGIALLIIFAAFMMIFIQIKNIIDERKKDSELLYENNLMIEDILESVPVGIVIVNKRKRVIMVNRNAMEMLEISDRNIILQKYWSDLFKISDPNKTIEIKNIEAKLIINKEKSIPIIKSAIPIQIKKELAIIEAFMDITDRYEAEEKLIKAIERVKFGNKSKDIYFNTMIQNLKNPIKLIHNYSKSLLTHDFSEKQKFYLDSIDNNSKYLLEHINDVNDLSSIYDSQIEIFISIVDVFSFSTKVKDIFSNLFSKKDDIRFNFQTDKNMPKLLYFDEKRLRQIISSILRSILQYTKRGEVSVLISYVLSDIVENTVDLIVKIEENFQSIPQEYIRKIFNSSTEISELSKTCELNSSILELAFSFQLAKIMNGTITVSDYKNRGRAFRIVLKNIKIADNQDIDTNVSEFDFNNIEFDNAKILLLDSNHLNCTLIKDFFANTNLQFIEMDDGYDAVYTTRMRKPDLIMISRNLKGLSDIETVRNIKNEKLSEDTPIIGILESEDELGSDNDFYLNYFNSVLIKPLNKAKLVGEFLKYLKNSAKPRKIISPSEKKKTIKIESSPLDLSKVIIELETTIKEEWKEVRNSHLINEIEDFGNKVRLLGVNHSIPNLQLYGEEIILASKNFDIPNLSATLKNYNLMVENLKSGKKYN